VSSDQNEKSDEATQKSSQSDHETEQLPTTVVTDSEDSSRVARKRGVRVKHKENVLHWSANAKTKNTPWSAEHLRLLEMEFMHFKKPPNSKSIKSC